MDNEQNVTLPEKPQGFSKWLGISVGGALVLMALVVGLAMFNSRDEASVQSESGSTVSQPQPSADDDALRKSLGQ